MSFGHEDLQVLPVHLGALSATLSCTARFPYGSVVHVKGAYFDSATAIDANSSSYYTFRLHAITAAGVHTTVLDDGTGLSYATAGHTAYVADEIGLTTTAGSKEIASGGGVEIAITKTSAAVALPIDARVYITYARGEGLA